MNKNIIFLALAVSTTWLQSAVVPVQITTSSNGTHRLLRNGADYVVKGIGGSSNLALAAASGANSMRTWGSENAQTDLDNAQANGLTVTLGIWLPHNGNYNDAAFRNAWKTTVTNLAQAHKNHPALLFWALGNELNIPANYAGTWTLLQELAAIIKSIDPNHPVMTVLAGAPTSVLNTIATTCPSIDLVGFNVYAGLDGVPSAVAAATNWTKPYMITEWGPNGHWESANTPWGRPIESPSTAKASLYSTRAALIDSWRPRCLGSYVFFWDQKQERTPTWYSMFLEARALSGLQGEACPTVDAMSVFWKGSVTGNRAPVFQSASVNGSSAPAQHQAAPGKIDTITVNATDADGDVLEIVAELLKEPSQVGDLGGWEGRPEALGDNARATGNSITLTVPPAGQYRLFAYILDGKGKAATWNLPILSTGTPLAATPKPFNGTPKSVPGTIEAEEFDKGGAGISYNDTTAGNSGGALRNTAVDIEPCTDTGGGHNIGWLAPGEWLQYRIYSANATTVRPIIRVANQNQGGVVRLLLNGTNITGNLTIPATGGWQTFTNLQAPSNISIAAGNHTLRLEVLTNGPSNSAVGNINSFIFEPAAASLPVVNYAAWQGTQGLAFSKAISASNAPTSYALTSGTLPAGLSLATSTGVVSGVPTANGNTAVSFTASNAAGTSASQTVAISIAPTNKPVITSPSTANATIGVPFSYQIAATNGPGSYSASLLPTGIAVSTTTGALTGTPTLYGTYASKISASNANGTWTQNLTITVAAVLPSITNNGSITARVGAPLSYRIMAVNIPRAFGASPLPSGLTINASTGYITGTPTIGGNTTLTLSATNPAGTTTKAVPLIVLPQPPTITSNTTASGTVGIIHSRQIAATGSPTKFTAVSLPPGLSINATSGMVSGIPSFDGQFASRITAFNAGGSVTQNLTYTIAATKPVITNNGTIATRVGSPLNYRVTAVNAPRTFGAAPLPSGLTINASTGYITGTPTTAGNSTLTLSATNAGGTGTKSIPFVVLPTLPVITSANSASATAGQAFVHQTTATNGPIIFSASGFPAGLSMNATTGQVKGAPAASGTFPAKLMAQNAGGIVTQNFTLTVTAAAPVITGNTTFRVGTGTFFSQRIMSLYSPTSFGASGLPTGLTINSTTGDITGIPAQFGTWNATLTASNNAGSGSLAVTFKILPVDPLLTRYVRIRSEAGGYLRETGSSTPPSLDTASASHDPRSHWALEATPDGNGIRIRNRLSGLALDVEGQSGQVRSGPLGSNFTSTHWTLNSIGGNVSMASKWQPSQFMCKSANGTLAYGPSAGTTAASRFVLEDLPAGASVPWITYDETNTTGIVSPAHIVTNSYNASFDIANPAAEASRQGCVLLNGFGTSVRWTATHPAQALTLRYSVENGVSGNTTLKITSVNGTVRTRKIPITSAQAWVYFDASGHEYNSPAAGRSPSKRYNEARIKLASSETIQLGETIEFARESGDAIVWIDLVEAETIESVAPPAGFLNVKAGYGALGDGVTMDTMAFRNAIAAAASLRKGLYIPAGTYRLDGELILPPGTILQGAGIWDTELIFTANGSEASGGIKGNGSNIVVRDFYMRSTQVSREAGFKGIKGWWGYKSLIENLWIDQATVGAWIADFNTNTNVTDSLVMRNCRIRNTFADGINVASGTRNSLVENCHIRGTGDDGLATWASGKEQSKPATANQTFRYNTIQCVYRAGGIGVFGGAGHKIHHNLVEDQVSGPGIRANSVFQMVNGVNTGWPFGTATTHFQQNTLRRVGSLSVYGEQTGAIELQAWYGPIQSLRFSGNRIEGSIYQAARFHRIANIAGASFLNILFENSTVLQTPAGVTVGTGSTGSATIDSTLSVRGVSNPSASFILNTR